MSETGDAYPWPVRRLIFDRGEDASLDACVGWVQRRTQDLFGYSEGYRRAATAFFEHVAAQGSGVDFSVFPIAFLWRQHIELALKDITATGRLTTMRPWGFENGHNLMKLWLEAKPFVLQCGDKDAPEVKIVEENITEFAKIDPIGDGFRYPVKLDGTPSMPNVPDFVNLRVLNDTMQGLANFLSGVHLELQRQWDSIQEAHEIEAARQQEFAELDASRWPKPPDDDPDRMP